MAEGTKFTEEEMKDISGLQQTYSGIQNALGQVSVARIRLEQQYQDGASLYSFCLAQIGYESVI